MSEDKKSVAVMKIPSASIDFLKRNPVLADKLGTLMVGLGNLVEKANQIRGVLKADLFKQDIQNGTVEELEAVIASLKATQDGPTLINDLPAGAFDKIVEGMKEKGVNTLVSDIGIKTESKEA